MLNGVRELNAIIAVFRFTFSNVQSLCLNILCLSFRGRFSRTHAFLSPKLSSLRQKLQVNRGSRNPFLLFLLKFYVPLISPPTAAVPYEAENVSKTDLAGSFHFAKSISFFWAQASDQL